jgi:tyrosine-protein kinase Etk/Wzc
MADDGYNDGGSYHPLHGASLPHGPGHAKGDDSVDVAQLWNTLRVNARFIFVVAALVFCLVMAFTFMSRMAFCSTGRLYLGELGGRATTTGGELDLSAGANSEASSEIEVLRSRSMVRRAILASGLNVTIAPPGWKPPRFWRWLVSGRDHRLLEVGSREVLAVNTTFKDDGRADPHEYSVKFSSKSTYRIDDGDGGKPVQGTLGQPLELPDLTLTLVEGTRGAPVTGAEYTLRVAPLEEVTKHALQSLQVTVPKSTTGEPVRVLTLEFTSSSPHRAARFLQELMRGYLWARQTWKTEDAAAAEAFVTKQLGAMQESLDRTQEKLADYRTENRVVVLENEAQEMVQQNGKYEEQRVAARLQVAALEDIKRALKNPKAPLEAYLFGEASDAVLQKLGASLSEARQQLTELNGRYKGASPDLQQQRSQVGAQRKAIEKYVTSRLARAKENLAALDGVIAQFDAKLRSVPSAQLGLAQIGRESEVYSRMYSYLLERQQQAAIIKASTVSKNRILDLPELPLREDSPKLLLHLASSVLGLLLGAALVIIRGLFSSVFRSESAVRGLLGGVVPIFASVPQRARQRVKQRNPPPLFDVLGGQPDPEFAEAFRSLRTNLYRAHRAGSGKVVLITSPSPGDGKTTCTLSLAAMLAADNKRVLVIDADVRNPTHHILTGLPQEPGLRDLVLRVNSTLRDAIHTAYLPYGSFDSISAGAAAQAELLSDGYLAALLVNIRAHYDFILLDTRSYPAVSDPLILAPMSDFVLSVVRVGNTPRKPAEEHLRTMLAVARGYAVVVNNSERAMVYNSPNLRGHGSPQWSERWNLEAARERMQ